MLILRKFVVFILVVPTTFSVSATQMEKKDATSDLYFDPALFQGKNLSEATYLRLSQPGSIEPGSYKIDIYTNGTYIERADVRFVLQPDGTVTPCFDIKTLQHAGIKFDSSRLSEKQKNTQCVELKDVSKSGVSRFNRQQLRLDLSIPQSEMINLPQGYVSPENLDAGASIGFINYLTNYYHVSYSDSDLKNQDSAWLSLNGGVNMGAWQFRQLSNLNWNQQQGTRWQRVRSYVQRPLPTMSSQLSAGELITAGRFFSGLNYNGINISTEDRILPDSMRGYAPVVRGVATTTSKVTISQNGQQIYQTTVSPGSFAINDLYPTSYSGDLDVEVTGADGRTSRFSVPFSAVPESMRPGVSHFDLAVGKTRDSGEKSLFGDLTWQHGLSNSITVNSGMRLADGYTSAVVGGVYGSYLGAFGLDLTASRAKLPGSDYVNGWMSHISYSKTFQPTNTTLSLASFRYSTSGYRDLSDVLGLRGSFSNDRNWRSASYQQQSRYDISMSQGLAEYGNLFISGSLQQYRNSKDKDTQLQLGYSDSLKNGISYNISLGKQFTDTGSSSRRSSETITSVSLSIPLAFTDNRVSSVNSSWTHSSSSGDQYQTSASGSIGSDQTLNYNVGAQHSRNNSQTTINGGLQQSTSKANLGINASRGQNYWQASAMAQGALAVHGGGVTFGPWLGDTFALVEAKGASGATMFNSKQSVINDEGYTMVPSLVPYRYNMLTLSPQGMADDVELIDNEKRIAPLAGATVKITFKTRAGTALIIKATQENGQSVPLGADVFDSSGVLTGMVAQNGQLYLRTDKKDDNLIVKWGEKTDEQCHLSYHLSSTDIAKKFGKKTAQCRSQ